MYYFSTVVFFGSGAGLVLLLLRPSFITSLISKGDSHARHLSHSLTHYYSELKDRALFFVEKQLPLHTRNFINKALTYIQNKVEHHIGNMRNSRLLKKESGISEYFKSMAEVEKGNGQIDETLELDSQFDEKKLD
jgi:hypothetical protein